ncbi:MAG: AtpZ/AtpI family protein [Oscillospiraceae bacterium]|nr:AtpZ/AtpI family protein [Oscillospiraceae bacterium]
MFRNDKERSEVFRALTFLSQIGIMIIVCVAIGVFLGNFLDGFLGTSPWLLLIFSLLGVAAAFKSIFDMSKRV